MKILIIANPKSGKGAAKKVMPRLKNFFEKNYAELDVYLTKKQNDATAKAKGAARSGRYDIIAACGGDGTVNEVLNGMVMAGKKGKKVRFGVIPLGTENVLAQETGIPFDTLSAARVILEGKTINIDLGNANGRYFVLMAGIGFDAHVASKLKPFVKKIIGRAVYPITAWNELLKYKHSELDITIDRKIKTKGTYIVVGNIKNYGAGLKITPKASISDGFVDACIFKGKDVFSFLEFIGGTFTKKHMDLSTIEYHKAKEVVVRSKDKVLCHVDCEVIGTTPVRIKACPGIVKMIVP
ncbi:hypothetical protein COV19_05880 [Candidatus Woesearchaeota archaeon CG10_big_fil_rev_8_21_14_0_10_44_13]|nr:MAG: hypothetical protein COV19_05880 [Candidatus Woesearchaeota archaeon CG10_big_fil_rev_8_21_14_0_10_44_13]